MSNNSTPDPDKPRLRQELRNRRRQINFATQRHAALRVKNKLAARHEFTHARRIAFYFANDGEISVEPLMELAHRMGKQCYVPVILGEGMQFQRYRPGQTLQRNQFGIPEPVASHPQFCHPRNLDLLFMPLVGFDRHGNRLGMGGGFYDRTLAFLRTSPVSIHHLRLIGVAHQCQEVAALPSDSWDIPLHAIVTDREFINCNGFAGEPGAKD